MLTAITFLIFLGAIVAAVSAGVPIVAPIAFGSALFALYARLTGHPFGEILRMMKSGVRKGILVFIVFSMVGMVTASWRASGTIAFFVYWGTRLLEPRLFLLCAFLLAAGMSYVAGTSFGTIGTMGVMLLVLARTGGVDPVVTAGAVIAGSYVGDRGSPASSSAILVSRLTGTDLMGNVKRMLRTGLVPFLLACVFFAVLSPEHPLSATASADFSAIREQYVLSPLCVLPAVVILLLPPLGCDIRLTMGVSLLLASLLAVLLQGEAALSVLKALFTGYEPSYGGQLADLLRGGGLSSMLQAAFVVLFASTYDGIFRGTDVLRVPETIIRRMADRIGLYPATVATSVVTSMVACNQTLAVMITQELMDGPASSAGASAEDRAMALENSVILIAPLIPWNIAVSAGLAVLEIGPGAIPYAAFLWLVPLCGLIRHAVRARRRD